jgi:hypothetical protein
MRRKAFKTTELKMPDIVGLQNTYTETFTLMKGQTVDISMAILIQNLSRCTAIQTIRREK